MFFLANCYRADGDVPSSGVEGVTEEDLIRAAQRGDKKAFQALVSKYANRALQLAEGVMGSAHDAEDVLQEAFVKAYLNITKFKGDSKFYTWLYRIVYNMAIDFKRRMNRRGGDTREYDDISERRSESLGEGTVSSSRFLPPDRSYSAREELSLVAEALSDLSPDHRAVLVLREVDGLSYEEISDTLNIQKGTVMSRLFYARKRLREVLETAKED